MPRVSIITACYNGLPYVAQTTESVLAQDYQDWEMVVLDDGSTDGNADVVQPYADRDARIRLIRQANTGAPIARYNAYHAITPDSAYLWCLDADDRLPVLPCEDKRFVITSDPSSGIISTVKRYAEKRVEKWQYSAPAAISRCDMGLYQGGIVTTCSSGGQGQ